MSYKKYTKQTWKGSVLTSPVPPTLVTSSYNGIINVFTVAWTGIMCTKPPVTYISVRPERYSYELIDKSGEFVINLASKELVKAVDICGVKSGKNTNKFELTGLTTSSGSKVKAPVIEQSPLSLECKVRDKIELGTHMVFVADIVAVDVAQELIDKDGRLELEKADLIAYSHGEYFELGKRLGSFGYSVRKKKSNKRGSKK
ncbi:flavin reductase family protein [Ruminococcus sp. FC2018]|uniref:flavin reductase family protein n=1 Tax=Ruminococcus sp. FC2018 TaxID=1410617 RepID=UPI000561DC98|nr:flavin reductase family protein [Ruminococcus sp. FC2018]